MTSKNTEKVSKLSQKVQNKTVSNNKKKSLKQFKLVFTTRQAIHWPLIIDQNEKDEIFKLLKRVTVSDLEQRLEESKNSKFDNKMRKFITFGVNEIGKKIIQGKCHAIILEASVPHILVAHLLKIAIDKQIPLICVSGMSDEIKSCFGFTSSTICFLDVTVESIKNICDYVSQLCQKHFKDVCSFNNTNSINGAEVQDKIKNTIVTNTTNANSEKERLKTIISEPDSIRINRKRAVRPPIFQSVIIKKMCKNENRKNKR